MSTTYPLKIDNNISLPLLVNKVTNISAETINILREAIVAVENELGAKPSSIYGTVRSRMETIEANIAQLSISPNLTINGDLGGTELSLKVIGIQGHSIKDETLGAQQDGYVLTWNNSLSAWQSKQAASGFTAGGDLSGTSSSQTVIGIRGITISSTVPNSGDFLSYNGSQWIPTTGTLSGDVNGSLSSTIVTSLTGSSGVVIGPTNGLSIGTSPSATGSLRLSNTGSIRTRNALNTDDIIIAKTHTDNSVTIGADPASISNKAAYVVLDSAGSTYIKNAGTIFAEFGSTYLSLGANTAASGIIRIPNGTTITSRNSVNNNDVPLITMSSSNIIVGSSTNSSLNATFIQGTNYCTIHGPVIYFSKTFEDGVEYFDHTNYQMLLRPSTGDYTIKRYDKGDDTATGKLIIASQKPYASAATNKNPGNIILQVPAPVAGGVDGYVFFNISGTDTVEINNNGVRVPAFSSSVSNYVTVGTGGQLTTTSRQSSRTYNVTSITGNYLVLSTDEVISVEGITATTTVTLPSSPGNGNSYVIVDTLGNAGTYNIIISGNGKNINGNATLTLSVAYDTAVLIYNGTSWSII